MSSRKKNDSNYSIWMRILAIILAVLVSSSAVTFILGMFLGWFGM